METKIDFTKNLTKKKLQQFADLMTEISEQIGFKVSSRGWCYIAEMQGIIDKSQFNKVENAINRCRKAGILPVDFVAEETARAFEGVVERSGGSLRGTLKNMLDDVLTGHRFFTPDYYKDEEYYIQMVVEKIDLKTLFGPVCEKYLIPIANSAGWSSILQRAEYCKRFKKAQDAGLKCVLLYCGDHDPDGLRISDTIRKNLEQVSKVIWSDGVGGFDPYDLEIKRFGLEKDFIDKHKFTWIDNLVTGSGKNLASPNHPNFKLEYLQNYLRDVGERKCEANVLVTNPEIAREFVESVITDYLGTDAPDRFQKKRDKIKMEYNRLLDKELNFEVDSRKEVTLRNLINDIEDLI